MKRKYILSLIVCGLLFACSDKESNNNEAIDTEPSQTVVEYEENEQGLAFYPQDDGTYAVGIGNAFNLSTIVVPSTYKGKAVTNVQRWGFSPEMYNLGGEPLFKFKKVILPESIVEIDEFAFYYSSIEEIVLPKSLKSIDESALECESLVLLETASTFNEFKNINFGTRWLETQKRGELKLKFSDKEYMFLSLFDRTKVWTYTVSPLNRFKYGEYNSYRKDVSDNITISLGSERYFYFTRYSSEFNKLPYGRVDIETEINDTNIVHCWGWGSDGSFSIDASSIGSTTIMVGDKTASHTFTCNVVQSFDITAHDAFETLISIGGGHFFDRYVMTGYAYMFNRDSTDYIYVKESLDDEKVFVTDCIASYYPSIGDGMKIKIDCGRIYSEDINSFHIDSNINYNVEEII